MIILLKKIKKEKTPSLELSTSDLKRYVSKGKIKITGKLSEAITEEMAFVYLSLSLLPELNESWKKI